MTDILFPAWRDEQENNNYPFEDNASLTNGTVALPPDLFLDAVFYPVGGQSGCYLAKIVVSFGSLELIFGDSGASERMSAVVDSVSPPSTIKLLDAQNRPAGLLIANQAQLSGLRSFGVGEYEFAQRATSFVADVCVPVPDVGVRGVLLDDGTLLTGDVWLCGGAGVQFEYESETRQGWLLNSQLTTREIVVVNVVGDPLFRRRLCVGETEFSTPLFIRTVTFMDETRSFSVTPDAYGDVQITVNDALASDTVLRVKTLPTGVEFSAVGEPLTNG